MITFTGDTIQIGDELKVFFDSSTELQIDILRRADTSVIAQMYAFKSGSQVGYYETAYAAVTIDSETPTETDYTAIINEIVHELEKARLEALNPTNTFTITL